MKFLALAAAATVATVQAQNATQVPCIPLNLTAKAIDIRTLNSVLDLAVTLPIFKDQIVNLDPLVISNNRLDPVPFSVLGHDFALTPIIKSLNATGIASLVPEDINVTSATSLAFGVNFNGSINADAALSFEIAMVNKQWWQLCWTNLLTPFDCQPSTIDVILGVGLVKPTVDLNISIGMNMCPPGLPRGTCSDVTVSNILTAAVGNTFPALLTRILKKFSSASIENFQVTVESLTKLDFDFAKSGPLLSALFDKLLGYTAAEVNKKGQLYNDIVSTVSGLGKTLLNQLITEELVPQFGNTCY